MYIIDSRWKKVMTRNEKNLVEILNALPRKLHPALIKIVKAAHEAGYRTAEREVEELLSVYKNRDKKMKKNKKE